MNYCERSVFFAGLTASLLLLLSCSSSPSATETTGGTSGGSSANATAVTITIAATSSSSINSLLGTNIGPIPSGEATEDLTDEYQEIGVTQIRTHDYYGPLDMATLYPDQSADPSLESSYDFTQSDTVFEAIIEGGFTPYLRLGDSYSSDFGYPDADPRAPTNQSNWIDAAIHIIAHYNDAARWGRSALQYVEIWNEPNHALFWDSTDEAFYSFFSDAVREIKAAYPSLKVGGPGLSPSAGISNEGKAFSSGLVSQLETDSVTPDFLSWHLYSNDPQQYTDVASYFRDLLDSHGFADVDMHVTEWNTSTSGLTDSEIEDERLGGKGTSELAAGWIAFQDAGIQASCFYRGTDPSIDLPTFYGLFYADGTKKRSALAFSLWKEIVAHSLRRTTTLSSDEGLWTIASADSSGEIVLMVANPNDEAFSLTAAVSGQSISSYTLVAQTVDDASESMQQETLSSPTFDVPAYSVVLVTMTP